MRDIPVVRIRQRLMISMPTIVEEVAVPDFRGDAAGAIAWLKQVPGIIDARVVGSIDTLEGWIQADAD